jgi:cysteine desulfurase
MSIYLDNAATTPLLPEVKELMKDVIDNHYGNPSSIHSLGRSSRSIIEKARKTISTAITCAPGEIFFTSCATESNNMVLKQSVKNLGVTRIISSPIEHHCVMHTIEDIQQCANIDAVLVKLNDKGHIDYDHLESLLKDQSQKTLVSLMHGNNEIGNITDLKKVSDLCKEYGALYHADTAQTMGKEDINVQDVHIDFINGSAHKFHGPKGAGFVYIYGEHKLDPLFHGGSQERNMRSGTENLICIAGMAKALELSMQHREEWQLHMKQLKDTLREGLSDSIPSIEFLGDVDNSLNHILSVSFPPSEQLDLLEINLDMQGIYASAGSACSSGSLKKSHVMEALNVDPGRKTVRFSFSALTTMEEIKKTIEVCSNICSKAYA